MSEQDLIQSLQEQISEIVKLESELSRLRESLKGDEGKSNSSSTLQEENAKLKFRLKHLKRTLDNCEKSQSEHSISVLSVLIALIDLAIQRSFPQLYQPLKDDKAKSENFVVLTPSVKEAFGDYQCNSAMNLSKKLKELAVSVSPVEVARKIVENIPTENHVIERVEVLGPGFINIFLKKTFIAEEVRKILVKGSVLPPCVPVKKKVVVDYSSPNIAKEMHVGHLRSTIIGDSISRLCEYLGHTVVRINHIGDWGTQFGMLIAHLKDTFPNYMHEIPPIGDLQKFYKESKQRFDSDPEFKKRAYQSVVKLQSYEPEHIQGWKLICEASRKEFQAVYNRLKIGNLVERGESFYHNQMKGVVDELQNLGLLEEDDGRLILWSNADKSGGLPPLTIVKNDGGYTYDTSDMSALKHRLFVEQADWILYVVDMGQSVHFQTIFGAGNRAGWFDSNRRVEHISFGVVLGEDRKKLKTRSGETIRLVDLLNEGLQRSGERLVEKERDKALTPEELTRAQESIAYSCIKYADLSHNRTNDYVFSFDKMLDDKGNTAAYLMYAYTRIRSIARNSQVTPDAIKTTALQPGSVTLEHPKEWKLAKWLCKFTDVILKIQEDFMLHSLCEYLYELSCAFSEFYDNCRCIEKTKDSDGVNTNMWRILLCEATATVMATGFDILGLMPVDKM